jgi:hypothetical protein
MPPRLASQPLLDSLELPADVAYRLRHETRGPAALITIFTFYALTVLFVAARLSVRIRISKHAGLDDWLIVASEVRTGRAGAPLETRRVTIR